MPCNPPVWIINILEFDSDIISGYCANCNKNISKYYNTIQKNNISYYIFQKNIQFII